ncbi:hypothetical protein [Enterococcus avium]|uniref:hypothetical protein n=1 Tax=Enterococcus avium TaxID=33945 RepID=UPI00288FC3A4|nr:hypothetical protein [Enterococcus avium]MDT2388175.1 hypothetical protein [Enterococcus avium]
MKKKITAVFFLTVLVTTPVTVHGAEDIGVRSDIQTGEIGTKSLTLKQWFKGVPPKMYRGKKRIDCLMVANVNL